MVNIPHKNFVQVMKWTKMVWTSGVHLGEWDLSRRILTRKPERKRPLGRRRHGWESTIQVELTEIGWEVAEKLLGSQEGLGSKGFVNDVHVI
jgi:hypothetical protein